MKEQLKLENQLCFKYYVISKEIIRKYKPLLDPLKLTYTSYITMLVLWEKDHITIKDLGESLTLDSGTLTPLLKKLEKIGYIKRVRSNEDERKIYICLTDKGNELQKKAQDIPVQISKAIFDESLISEEGFRRRKAMLDEVFELVISKK